MRTILATLAVAAIAALAPTASALYIVTPLFLTVNDNAGEVGDVLEFEITPENETTAAEWGGKTVSIVITYPTAEPSDDPEATYPENDARETIVESVQLSDDATASFTWTLPASLDRRNVHVMAISADEEVVAQTDITVGDAPPNWQIMAMTGMPEEEPVPTGEPEPAPAEPTQPTPAANDEDLVDTNAVPGFGIAALALGAVALALVLRRR